MSTDKVIAHFKMTRAVIDDAETAALEAAGAHAFQLDGLSKQVTALTQENGELALEAARLRKSFRTASDVAEVAEAARREATTELTRLRDEVRGVREMCHGLEVQNRQWQRDCNAATAELARLMDLDMMRLQMPDGYVAETIEQALRGWKAGYDEVFGDWAGMVQAAEVLRGQHDNAVAELAHVRAELAATLCVIEKAATEAAERVAYANVDTSLSDPRPGRLLVIRIDDEDVDHMGTGSLLRIGRRQFVGWLEAAQDEGDSETKPVDVHHEGLPMPVVRCGECTATVGHFGDCVKAVTP